MLSVGLHIQKPSLLHHPLLQLLYHCHKSSHWTHCNMIWCLGLNKVPFYKIQEWGTLRMHWSMKYDNLFFYVSPYHLCVLCVCFCSASTSILDSESVSLVISGYVISVYVWVWSLPLMDISHTTYKWWTNFLHDTHLSCTTLFIIDTCCLFLVISNDFRINQRINHFNNTAQLW